MVFIVVIHITACLWVTIATLNSAPWLEDLHLGPITEVFEYSIDYFQYQDFTGTWIAPYDDDPSG
jgi:hypothetical protein